MTDVGRWPDGCPKPDHHLDGLCALTRPERLPTADEPESKDENEGVRHARP